MWKCTCCETLNQDEQSTCIVCGEANKVAALPGENEKKARKKEGFVSFKAIVIVVAALIAGFVILLLSNQKQINQGENAISLQSGTALEPVYLTMGFHQTYQCSISDFDLAEDVVDQITWSCAANDAGVTCSPNGVINTGNILVDPALGYNKTIQVIGMNGKNITLTYYLTTGNDQRYEFNWSGNRIMKSYNGPVYQITPMVTNCSGFTLAFKSDLTSGDIIGDQWSVWVRENGTDWVYIQDISLQNDEECTSKIVFDREISFSEVAVQPPKQYNPYSNTVYCEITSLLLS